jgi:hypothetical protein
MPLFHYERDLAISANPSSQNLLQRGFKAKVEVLPPITQSQIDEVRQSLLDPTIFGRLKAFPNSPFYYLSHHIFKDTVSQKAVGAIIKVLLNEGMCKYHFHTIYKFINLLLMILIHANIGAEYQELVAEEEEKRGEEGETERESEQNTLSGLPAQADTPANTIGSPSLTRSTLRLLSSTVTSLAPPSPAPPQVTLVATNAPSTLPTPKTTRLTGKKRKRSQMHECSTDKFVDVVAETMPGETPLEIAAIELDIDSIEEEEEQQCDTGSLSKRTLEECRRVQEQVWEAMKNGTTIGRTLRQRTNQKNYCTKYFSVEIGQDGSLIVE